MLLGRGDTQREDQVKTEGEDGHHQPRRAAWEDTGPADTMTPDFWPPELQEN